MQSDFTLQSGGQTYQGRYGQNAMFLIEKHLAELLRDGILRRQQISIQDPKTKQTITRDVPVNMLDLAQLPRRMNVQIGLWAALEAARLKYHSRPEPFTIAEVGEIIDDGPPFTEIETSVVKSFKAAFPEYFPSEESTDDKTVAETAEKNDQAETGPTGTRRSSKRPKSESAPTNSGT